METPFRQFVTFIYTNDLAASATFYHEILGLPLALDQGSCRIYQVSADGYLGVCQGKDIPPGEQSKVILTLVTPDVDQWYARLASQGVVFEKAPSLNHQYNIYHCFLRDPNGYLLEIQRFLDPQWPA
jgi:catechol 2,3-dioxygenase-like lactoylglutathione lyase family enzyme